MNIRRILIITYNLRNICIYLLSLYYYFNCIRLFMGIDIQKHMARRKSNINIDDSSVRITEIISDYFNR